jgi:hypothetical protein
VLSGGDRDDIRVIRGTLEQPVVYQASLDDIVDGERPDAEVFRGDVLFVQDHPLEDFSEVLLLAAPFAGVASTLLLTAIVLQRQ